MLKKEKFPKTEVIILFVVKEDNTPPHLYVAQPLTLHVDGAWSLSCPFQEAAALCHFP